MSRPDNHNEREFQEEWLSAYLDDELSPSQRAIVEQQLKSDVATEKLFNDLTQIRGLVRALPEWSGRTLTMPVLDLIQEPLGSSADPGDYHDELKRSDGKSVEDESLAASSLAVALAREAPYEESVAWDKSGTIRSASTAWFRPIVLAASILAALGIGYVLWRGDATWSLASVSRRVDSAANTENLAAQESVNAAERLDKSIPSSEFDGVANDQEAAAVAAKDMQADAAPLAMAADNAGNASSGLAVDARQKLVEPTLGADKALLEQSPARPRSQSPARPNSPAFSAGEAAADAMPSIRLQENRTVPGPGTAPGASQTEIRSGADFQAGGRADPSAQSGLRNFIIPESQSLPAPSVAASESSSALLVSYSTAWNPAEIEAALAQLSPLLGLQSVDAQAEVDGKLAGQLASAPPVAIITRKPASTLQRISEVVARTPITLTDFANPNFKTVQSTSLPTQALFLNRHEAQQLIEAIRTAEPSLSPVWITSVAALPPVEPAQKVVLLLSSQ